MKKSFLITITLIIQCWSINGQTGITGLLLSDRNEAVANALI